MKVYLVATRLHFEIYLTARDYSKTQYSSKFQLDIAVIQKLLGYPVLKIAFERSDGRCFDNHKAVKEL